MARRRTDLATGYSYSQQLWIMRSNYFPSFQKSFSLQKLSQQQQLMIYHFLVFGSMFVSVKQKRSYQKYVSSVAQLPRQFVNSNLLHTVLHKTNRATLI